MTPDIVRELGHLTLGSRLKRLGERLQAQTQVVLGEADISLPASHLVVLAALDRLGPLSVGELAEALGTSQPGISRMVENLRSDGLVASRRPAGDKRVRPIAMTDTGRQLLARAKRLAWPRVEAAVVQACAGASGPLLAQLSALEEALANAPLRARAARISERGKNMLDRPIWSALSTLQLHLSLGGPLARRYTKDVNLFASASNDSVAALDALASLVEPGERVFALQVPDILVPAGFAPVKAAKGVQMVATRRVDVGGPDDDLVELTDADAPEMLALARLTEPGPFLTRTHTMGRFVGIRIDGQLAAMAGERFRFPGYTEVSGVCTHPDFRHRGLARRLSTAVAAHIESRGERPFLHAWKTNTPAIALYESLGFQIRAEVDVKVLQRVD